MTCERCYQDIVNDADHGVGVCPLEPRSAAGASVLGDEIDVTIRHGLCWPGGEPRRFTSRAELARAAQEKGLINYVRHVGAKGSDKSPHTSRWI